MADSAARRVAGRNAAMGRPGGRPSSGAATWEGQRWADSARPVRRTWLRPADGRTPLRHHPATIFVVRATVSSVTGCGSNIWPWSFILIYPANAGVG
jgi:hypothetical protein